MTRTEKSILGAAAFVVALCCTSWAHAEDTLKVTIGQMQAWAQQPPILGQEAGIFKKLGLVLDNIGTQGAGETLQPIIAGSADIGIGIGTVGVMGVLAMVCRRAAVAGS